MEFVDRQREQLDRQRQSDFAIYRKLVKKASTGKALTEKEDATLTQLLASLNLTVEKLEADARAFARHEALGLAAAELPKSIAAREEAITNAHKIQTELDATLLGLQKRMGDAKLQVKQAAQAVLAAESAKNDLEQLGRENWRLFDLTDPAIDARRRHLAKVVFGRPRMDSLKYSLVEFENLMKAADRDNIKRELDGNEFVPLPGQTQAELDALLTEAKQLADAEKRAFYLLPAGMDIQSMVQKDVIVVINRHLDKNCVLLPFVLAPGQSVEEFMRLFKELKKTVKRNTPNIVYGPDASPPEQFNEKIQPTLIGNTTITNVERMAVG